MPTADIPPIQFQDYPIDVTIRIYRQGARYKADIFALGQMHIVPIELSPHDLPTLNMQLQEAMQVVVSDLSDQTPKATISAETQLRPLAEFGRYLFGRMFGHQDALAAIERLTTRQRQVSVLQTIQKRLSHRRPLSIQVVSEDFSLPWELLYPAGLDEPLSYKHFWGMSYIISRVIAQEHRPGAFVSPVITFRHQPKLGLLTYCGLSSVLEKEIPFFEYLASTGQIALSKLRALNFEKKTRRDPNI